MSIQGFNYPSKRSYGDTFRFLTNTAFPLVMSNQVEHYASLPVVGTYRQVNPEIKSFKRALDDSIRRQFTLSGIGSLIDFDRFGHVLKRPTHPSLIGGSCQGNTLCIEPTCFGFTEGVIENANQLRNMCWSLSIPCLKDHFYSDADFGSKMLRYIGMYMAQGPAVLEAYQRTDLIRESIKVIATSSSVKFTGSVFGNQNIPLPFFMDPVDARSFPNVSQIPGGANGIGGLNIMAFVRYMAPRLMSKSFSGQHTGWKVYGIESDYYTAKCQTAEVSDKQTLSDIQRALTGASISESQIDSMIGEFKDDSLMPTFKINADGDFEPVTAEHLEPSTILGYLQTENPEHAMQDLRALLFVPNTWTYDLVEPEQDDFTMLGLGKSLDFRNSTPGVFPLLSTGMFSNSAIGKNGIVSVGERVDPKTGMVVKAASGIQKRPKPIKEAVRTDLVLTYSGSAGCGSSQDLSRVGAAAVPQGRADGFALKSTMFVGTNVVGRARPVLVLFRIDQPRATQPIEVCNVVSIEVTPVEDAAMIVRCSPGNQTYAVLEFDRDVSGTFVATNKAVYRTGPGSATFLVDVDSVSSDGKVVSISSDADPIEVLPCCQSGKDRYGTMGQLLKTTGVTTKTAEIHKAEYDTNVLYVELFTPIAAAALNATGKIVLTSGEEIAIRVNTATTVPGVLIELKAAASPDECPLASLDCACLAGATLVLD